MKSLRIECIGIPGSGKTSLCHALKVALVSRGRAVVCGEDAWVTLLRRRDDGAAKNLIKRLPAAWLRPLRMTLVLPEFARATARNPAWIARHLNAIAGMKYPEEWAHMLVFAFMQSVCDAELGRDRVRDGEVWLRDEGLCQRYFSVHGYSETMPSAADVDAYFEALELPDILIRVQTPAADCHRRLARRPFYPVLVGRHPQGQWLDRWRHADDCVELVSARCAAHGVHVIPASGSTCPDAEAWRIIAQMKDRRSAEA